MARRKEKGDIRSAIREARCHRQKLRTGNSRELSVSNNHRQDDPQLMLREAFLKQWLSILQIVLGVPAGHVPLIRPALFVPLDTEPDISLLLDTHASSLLPVVYGPQGRKLPAPEWASFVPGDSLEHISGGDLYQPVTHELSDSPRVHLETDVDIVLAPALAVDRSGTRLGQGGGWYDRALAKIPNHIPIISAIFDTELYPRTVLPCEPHDIPVHGVITPTQAIVFEG